MMDGGVSPIPREARPYQGQPAGVVTRVAAAAIDAGVVAAVLLLSYCGLAVFVFLLDPRSFTFPDSSLLRSLTSALIVLVVYLTAAWWLSGRTYGDLVLGLRVLNHNGRRLRLPGAPLRAAFCAFVPIGLLWCAVSREKRSLQDVFLRTRVVYDWEPRRHLLQGTA
jgi:uncharacterized RDD family membrane protein YckC